MTLYAQVRDGTATAVKLPDTAKRLDGTGWVSGLSSYADDATLKACGYYPYQLASPPTTTSSQVAVSVGPVYDSKTDTVVDTWTVRAKTADEVTADTATTNRTALQTNLTTDLAAMQTIINTPNAQINPAAAIKDIARMLRRLGRVALNDYRGTD